GRDLTDEAELLVADQLQHSLEGLARMAAAVVVAVVAAVAAVFLATVALAAAALPAVATVVPVVVAGAVVAGAVVAGAVVPVAAPVLIRVGVVGRVLRPVRFLGRVGRHRIRGGDEFGFGLTVGAGAARGPLPGRLAFGSGLRCGRLGGVRGRLLRAGAAGRARRLGGRRARGASARLGVGVFRGVGGRSGFLNVRRWIRLGAAATGRLVGHERGWL